MKTKIIFQFPILILSFFIIQSCKFDFKPVYDKDEKKAAELLLEDIHSLYNFGKYDGIYDEYTQEARKTIDKKTMASQMKSFHENIGDFVNVIDKRVNVVAGSPIQVRLIYVSHYTKMDMTEQFICIREGDEMKLAGSEFFRGKADLPVEYK